MMVPHIKNLYIYDGQEYEPLGVLIVATMKGEFNFTSMGVEDIKQDEEVYEILNRAEEKLIEQAKFMRELFDSVLDQTGRLEAMEDSKEVKLETHWEEIREAWMQILEEEDPNTWIKMLEKEDGRPSTFPSPPSFQTNHVIGLIFIYSGQ